MVLRAFTEALLGVSKFELMDLDDFPFEEYEDQWVKYTEAERWFNGTALNDQPEASNKADLYPMRINPILGTVMKHTSVLFGEVEDDARPLVIPKFLYSDDTEKVMAEENEKTLSDVWYENNGRALMVENGLLSQIYGGAIFAARWSYRDWDKYGGWRRWPIRVERINPKNAIVYPGAGDDFRLGEAWIVREIRNFEARKLGYSGDNETVWYVEHWTDDEIKAWVDGKPAMDIANGKPTPISGENPFGRIPITYIPHIRIGGFKGINAFDHLTNIVRELNLRWGDFGDAVNDDSHPITAIRNVNGSVQVRRVNEWLEVVDLGSSNDLISGGKEPDMFQVNDARASQAMENMIGGIYEQYRRDAFVPPVADGEDEGSQRSGLTLAIRFWPMTSHANMERFFWTAGLNTFENHILHMLATKKVSPITEKHTRLRSKQRWAPMLPRDREIDVNEWSIRSANALASFEHLVELAGDVEDIPEERTRTLEWIRDLEKAKIEAQYQFEMEQLEKEQEGDVEIAELQGENQLKVAKEQPNTFGQRPAGGGQS